MYMYKYMYICIDISFKTNIYLPVQLCQIWTIYQDIDEKIMFGIIETVLFLLRQTFHWLKTVGNSKKQ